MKTTTKGVHVTLGKGLAERLLFLRKFKHRIPELTDKINAAVAQVIAEQERKLKITPDTWKTARTCPACAHGTLLERHSTKRENPRPFLGCSRYPECKHSESINKV